jgi:hypothetical protein
MPLALASFVNPIAPCAPAVTTTISRPSLLPYSYFSQLPIASRQEISTSSYSSNRPSHACFRPTLTPDQFSEDSIALLLGELAALGVCQPDGTFVTSLADLRDRLVEMAATSEAVCIDGLATRVQRPRSWANQKVLYDAKRHTHTAQGVVVSTIHGDLLWCDGGWPGSCHEHELLALSGIAEVLDVTRAVALVDRGFRGLATTRQHWHAPIGDRRTRDRLTDAARAHNRDQAGLRALVEQSIGHLAGAWSLRRWRGLLYRVRAVYRAAAALISLGRWLHRIPA